MMLSVGGSTGALDLILYTLILYGFAGAAWYTVKHYTFKQ